VLSVSRLPESLNVAVLVSACGFERRCTHVASSIQYKRGIAVPFLEHRGSKARRENDADFRARGFRMERPRSANDSEALVEVLIESLSAGIVTVDVSSMPRVWYCGAMRALARRGASGTVYFLYAPGKWSVHHGAPTGNRVVEPVPGFVASASEYKPAALVLGLGTEPDRALGLREHIDPPLLGIFAPQAEVPGEYESSMLARIGELRQFVLPEHEVRYPVSDPYYSYVLLESMVAGLQRDWYVVLASLGPKIFGVCSALVALVHPTNTSLWRVAYAASPDRQIVPDGSIVGLATAWWHQSGNEILASFAAGPRPRRGLFDCL
jgi:hypothetical protein